MPRQAGMARLNAISSRHYNQIIEKFERLGTWAWDASTGIMRWSPGLYRALGQDMDRVEPSVEQFIALAHPDDRWSVQELLRDTSQPTASLVRFVTRQGELVWFACHREVLRQNEQAPVVLGVMHDVTELKTANAIVGQRGRLLGSLVSLLNGMMWRAKPDGTIVFDMGWCEFTGTTLIDNAGEGWLRSIHPDDRTDAIAAWRRASSTNSLYSTAYRLRRADGSYQRMEARAAPILVDGAVVEEWVGYCAPSLAGDEMAEPDGPADARLRPTPEECRAARALLGWTVQHLAQVSGVSSATITRFESPSLEKSAIRPASRHDLATAFEESGVRFGSLSSGRASLQLL